MNFGIIAAGEGSRLKSEGFCVPKPLVPLCGKPMIGRLLDIFEDCGAGKISVIVNSEMPEVKEYILEKVQDLKAEIDLIVKSTPSSMHSFFEIAQSLAPEGRFIVTTVDTVFREDDFKKYVESFSDASPETDGMMAVTSFIDDEKPLYVDVDTAGRITGFLDNFRDGIKYISAGIYGLGPKSLPVLESCLDEGVSRMRNYQRRLVADGLRLLAFPLGKVVDVDHASDVAVAEAFLKD